MNQTNADSTLPTGNPISDRRLPEWLLAIRIPLIAVAHLLIFSVTWILAFVIRFDAAVPPNMLRICWMSLPIVVPIQLLAFYFCKTYHGWWRYVTFRDLVSFVKPLVISYLIINAIAYLVLPFNIPRSIPIIQVLLAGLMLAVLRSSWRIAKEGVLPLVKPAKAKIRAFIVSNHHETLVLANQINSQQRSTTRIVGILCFEKHLIGAMRAGIPILGTPDDAPRLAAKHDVQQVWFIAGSLSGAQIIEMKKRFDEAGLISKVIPAATDRNPGSSFIPVREIDINDLLRREPVDLDSDQIAAEIAGSRVMVTGAGGSIGSELCRQLLRFNPSHLILVDHRENSVFMIHNELNHLQAGDLSITELIPAVGDILDAPRMTQLFEEFQPQYVYHAAAHKHVGLMESNAGEAIKNNVLGTKQVADLANEFGVIKFVLVSTDKAVNPTSVMGCTKQLAERYVLSLGSQSKTQYVVVRFGNVLGSAGSVVPLFKEQIARGGPITITDPRMTRFFMTIPEATQLILQAGSMGEGGEIFVLDMGDQIRVVELAEKMIELAGLPRSAIEIKFVGARPGEKLFEELYLDEEQAIKTTHHKIFAARHRALNFEDVLQSIDQLARLATAPNDIIRDQLKQFIPEYHLDEEKVKS
ncbi:MAG TPA: nucleoside-diphosphate sugar epimerase/dehydratase [Pirellulaceae bacterium]|nr:nucleoside-diphosphate sugar epimerase/dehydratase [Pirellulaceae bacterium]HMO93459.1 nucleoside-diphosphate sugar epimerase/dehydratase [Pirellulaceae bacterium]HMP68433.1 nucleoside-diphosphate sugar epimerase/dehydratase [Pirellulaceae bacterium]